VCALAPHADSIAGGAPTRVLGCERVEVGAFSVLLRVTVALDGVPPQRAAGARLVVLDGGQERRVRALPGPVPAQAAVLSLGYALVPEATAIALELDGRRLALPPPRVRPLGAPASLAERLAAPNRRAAVAGRAPASVERRSLGNALRAAETQLGVVQAKLQEARATSARIEAERDEARRAAAHAEAAAHDATARAEALAGEAPAGEPAAPRGMSRRRTLAGAVCALGTGAVVVGLLAWPGGGGSGRHGDGGVAAASSPTASGPRAARAPFIDPLAGRLGIPPAYLTLYRQAGARYGLDWTRLAAVGAVESVHGQALAAGVTSGANHRGASGPAQFLASTWSRFGVDGDADGVRDPHDPADAIPAMASYLRASGAPEDWRGALRTYNHSDVYASAVERLAASYRRAAG
jgi:hypothetical protein